ncbi:MAG TPA: hypothetical protein VGS80_23740, partial [Ktedonobacterales bacterium]|nr:hypothetical protein [Ktedonobacterales bacterium]
DTTPTVKTLDASTVQVSAQHLAGGSPLEVEVAFPNAELDASVQRQPWQTTDTPLALPTALGQTNSQPVVTTGPGGVLAPLTGLCGLGFVPIMFFFLMIFAFIRSIMGVGPRGGYLGGQLPGAAGAAHRGPGTAAVPITAAPGWEVAALAAG